MNFPEVREQSLHALHMRDPVKKAEFVQALGARSCVVDAAACITESPDVPGRPERPILVSPFQVKQRSMHTQAGRAALIHALAHIEFNALNLALDAVWRFAGLPEAYYRDWLRVASEEAKHFLLLDAHLKTLGHVYGDFTAHNGLWEMAERTCEDVLARIALVPRILEARGLDVSLPIRNKLLDAGDTEGAAILDIILHDEIGHVAIGNYWYRWLCAQRSLDPIETFARMMIDYHAPMLKPPFNMEARRAAGFDEIELEILMHAIKAASAP